MGAAIAVLSWPAADPTQGPTFWWRTVGAPNGVFLILLGIARVGYEAQWYRAHHWNAHRQKWLRQRVREAQRPLQVLGAGYCLPLQGHADLVSALSMGKTLIDSRAPRCGGALVAHNRFDEESCSTMPCEEPVSGDVDPDAPAEQEMEAVATIVLKMVEALNPLCAGLHLLSQYGQAYAPVVRVLARPELATDRVRHVQDALRRIGLPNLVCEAVTASDALMVADAWLDLRECRPLLVIAAEWHDADPPVNSAEACVAVLLNPGCFVLPDLIKVVGVLHRPLAGEASELGERLANAIHWGKAVPAALARAWISAPESDMALLAALNAADLPHLGELGAQRHPDRIIGDAGAVNAWLSVAAAIESRETGSHLILDRAQAAVLHVLAPLHEQSEHQPAGADYRARYV
ncbi:hypothetical protein [Cupriavidus campinensis]